MHRFIGHRSRLFDTPGALAVQTTTGLDELELSTGVQHFVDVADHLEASLDLAAVVKRCMVSGAYVVLLTPPYEYIEVGPDDHLTGSRSGWRLDDTHRAVEAALMEIGATESRYCLTLPPAVSVTLDHSGGESLEGYQARTDDTQRRVSEAIQRAYSVPSGADFAMVRKLNAQDTQHSTVTSGLVLPSVRNLSIEDLTRLRDDNEEAFSRLQHALKKYLDGLSGFDSEKQFRALIEEIDHECRSVKDELDRLKRKHTRSLAGMAVTGTMLGIAAAVSNVIDPGLAAALAAAIGSVSARDVLNDRLQKLDTKEDLKRSAYWVTWAIHDADSNAAKR